ncbi:hypothetical protein VKT23_001844 [Stygiomarasmius scandens]|uniref:Fe2OG dioxygenase domain-containing protein n=1 Tax=Marasmiellus scandens TaxID=2682957 RepID=A0ABR1K5M9_9AGAR
MSAGMHMAEQPTGGEKENGEEKGLGKLDDFKNDLLNAFRNNFQFKGSFAFGAAFPSVPNPTLSIDGIGGIGLPLTEHYARSIIENAHQAPFGHNQETIVNTQVRDTFEIDASKVHFRNPAFENWLRTEVLKKVASELGTQSDGTKIELYKLLLYKEGSHFHKHQDTAKSPGMFATIIIVLPSEYTGGELVLSHADSSKTFDFSSESLLSTIVMAWYTDVFHEVKPVTSGYRLALSFNLVRSVSSSLYMPGLPDTNRGVENVRTVLSKWQKERAGYEGAEDKIAYMLDHQYSESDLREGVKSLKGQDAQLVMYVRKVAEELGFVLALANLEFRQKGIPDDDGYEYHKRGRYDGSDDDCGDDFTAMMEVSGSTLSISCLYDLDGVDLVEMDIDESALVPEDYFEHRKPDDEDYDGYMGNECGELEHYYHTSALIVLHGEEPTFACPYKTGQALAKLAKSDTANSSKPSSADRELALAASKTLKHAEREQILQVLHLACLWKDTAFMKNAFHCIELAYTKLPSLLEVWQVFGWDVFSSELEKSLTKMSDISRIQFLNELPSNASVEDKPIVQEWLNKINDSYILTLKKPYTTDIPFLLTAIRQHGFEWFMEKVFPNLVKENDGQGMGVFLFWKVFVKDLLESDVGASREASPVLNQCLQVLAMLWDANRPSPYSRYHNVPTADMLSEHADNIVEIAELAVRAGHPDTCAVLFEQLLARRNPTRDTFQTFYEKLVPRIGKIKNLDVAKSEPFKQFMHKMITQYLRQVLGIKPKGIENIKMRTVGCGCGNCAKVNEFLRGCSDSLTLAINKQFREHLVKQLDGAKDLISYEIASYGRPQPITITKTLIMAKKTQWEESVKKTKAFLKGVGNQQVVKGIMGNKYEDVVQALEGSKPFEVQGPTSSLPRSIEVNTQPGPSSSVAGKKRKKATGDVIDLTLDD